MINTGDSVVAS